MLALPYKRFIYKFDGDFLVSNKAVTLVSPHEIRSADHATDGDTGCAVWDAAVSLVRFLEKNPEYVADRLVLEIGCGLGLCGISCVSIGANHVTLTDMDYILQSTQRNILFNKVEKQAVVCCLDWFDPEIALIQWNDIDIIIASDVIWLEHLITPFVQTLVFASKRNPNVTILMSNQRRSDMVWNRFISGASSHFTLTLLSSDGSLEIYCLSPR